MESAAFLLLFLLGLYFLPGIIAGVRKHPNAVGIWLLTLFLGWTFIGWVVALVWAFSSQKDTPSGVIPVDNKNLHVGDQLQKLLELKSKGALTEEEFSQQKKRLLG